MTSAHTTEIHKMESSWGSSWWNTWSGWQGQKSDKAAPWDSQQPSWPSSNQWKESAPQEVAWQDIKNEPESELGSDHVASQDDNDMPTMPAEDVPQNIPAEELDRMVKASWARHSRLDESMIEQPEDNNHRNHEDRMSQRTKDSDSNHQP